jgi:putative flippase GtrA
MKGKSAKENDMMNSQDELRTRYSFSDFLSYTCLLAVPILTAILAVFKHSFLWAIAFIVLAAGMTVLILKFYCTRCPHYTREDKTLKCIFFWNLPKFFTPRPGALNVVDKFVAFGAPAVLLLFPLYWLFKEPGLLIVYILSLSGFVASIYHNECKRCIYFECPVNKVPEVAKHPSQDFSK